jgi:hypothetical protein
VSLGLVSLGLVSLGLVTIKEKGKACARIAVLTFSLHAGLGHQLGIPLSFIHVTVIMNESSAGLPATVRPELSGNAEPRGFLLCAGVTGIVRG